jgi:tetratricopeptide (TPR) repeat protein
LELQEVRVWEEEVVIPTYEIGEADKNPIFLENRVYQGSSGKVYPYPIIEKISDEKVDKTYKAVYLENEYLKIMILPELGGRIQRALDKTNNYDFIYYNKVIKPALVGLLGPWISGGIEFNWPQHHRPTTFMPVDYTMVENRDGSKTVLINDVDQMYGTKGIAGFTLYPDKAYLEIKGQLYNRTPHPQTFLWWANPAVAVNDHTQSIFPPDVHAVMDHGKRDVSRFPIATGVYYKHDYSEGVDISRYKNIPVPTSYMAAKSEYNFVGGYDYNKKAGILHVADHHISPGKKQWTWGCGDFGKAWDRNLTDEDGPYIELMTGVYTDNQPDFTWLKPFEEKTFKQYFMPYKAVGAVKNATINGAVNLECQDGQIYICAYTTSLYEKATIVIYDKGIEILKETITISPNHIYERKISVQIEKETDLHVQVQNGDEILVEYKPQEKKIEELPDPAEAAKDPEDIRTNEELYLTGLHIEQYRHATYLPDPYYLEGLKRDPGDLRINNAYGSLLLRRGLFEESEEYFKKAIKRSNSYNTNPYNSEPYYNLGLSYLYQEKYKEAFDVFYKATWTNEQQEMSFYYLAALSTRKKDYVEGLEFINKSLVKNSHNIKARGLKAALLRKLNQKEVAKSYIKESLEVDPFDYLSMYELHLINIGDTQIIDKMNGLMRNFHENYLQIARDYAEAGLYEEAIGILKECQDEKPMLKYYEGYYYGKLIKEDSDVHAIKGEEVMDATKNKISYQAIKEAEDRNSDYCFPNKSEDIQVLSYAIKVNPQGSMAYYYLGNLYYDKLQYKKAKELWEESITHKDRFSIVYRNLALAYYNKFKEPEKARIALEKAFFLNKSDDRIFLELDQLYKKLGMTPEERLERYDRNQELFIKRDDLYIEYITLHNLIGKHKKAYDLIMSRTFHPWEGGEGKVTSQYTISLVEMAKVKLKLKEYEVAKSYLEKALYYPENLGEGKLEGTKDNHIYYYLGCVMEGLNQLEKANEYYEKASEGTGEVAGMMYYNDQPADMILYQGLAKLKLGKKTEANSCFYKLIDYGEKHIFDEKRIEYFAVSLPDFLIFEDNLSVRNQAHCYYLIGLGKLGLGEDEEAKVAFHKALGLDQNHMMCRIYAKGQ